MPGTVAAVVKYANMLAAGNYGYSQISRWSGYRNGKLVQPGNFDCSSSTGVILKLAGYNIDLTGTFYTGNIHQRVIAAGYRPGPNPKGKSVAWLRQNVVAGAVLTGPHHVVVGVGGGKVLSFEYSEKGTADGKPGDQTGREGRIRDVYPRSKGWDTLDLPPAETVSKPAALALRAAQASQQAQHFGGRSDYTERGRKMAKLGASLIGATETTVTAKGKTRWSGRVAMQAGLGKGWTRAAFLALCLFWPTTKYKTAGKRRQIGFGPESDIWHGAMIVPLLRKDAKVRIDVGEVHIRPHSVATDAQKLSDVRRTLALVNPNVPTILMGDWAGNWDTVMAEKGFTRATEKVDTYDPEGNQFIDAVYISHHLHGDTAKTFNPLGTSDHKWVSVRVTKALVAV